MSVYGTDWRMGDIRTEGRVHTVVPVNGAWIWPLKTLCGRRIWCTFRTEEEGTTRANKTGFCLKCQEHME